MSCVKRARSLSPPRSEIEVSALRWELYASLQNILDATAMIVSDLGLRKPNSYAELGVLLNEAGLVDGETCDAIKLIAVTRNILAHAYSRLTIDDLDEVVNHALPKAEHVVEVLRRVMERKGLDPEPVRPISIDIGKIAEVFKKHDVVLAYLFGNRAKYRERLESDYDIAVLFNKPKVTIIDEVELAMDVAQALRIPSDKVDIVALNNADITLKARILREGIAIYMLSKEQKAKWEKQTILEILHTMDLYSIYVNRMLEKRNKRS